MAQTTAGAGPAPPLAEALCAGAHDAGALAAEYGTPLYLYCEARLRANWETLGTLARRAAEGAGAEALVCYSLKANPHLALVSLFASLGAGADLVSGGELARAKAAGAAPERTVFAGAAKTDAELAAGLEAGILQFNVESEGELAALERIAQEKGVRAPFALRLNPAVAGGGHDKISTGRAGDKFGLSEDEILRLAAGLGERPALAMTGLSVHVGSQLETAGPLAEAWEKLARLFAQLRGLGLPGLATADLGGGLGVAYGGGAGGADGAAKSGGGGMDLAGYEEALAAFARSFADQVAGDERAGGTARIILEPGRFLVADAGALLARVVRRKHSGAGGAAAQSGAGGGGGGGGGGFVLLDAAMNDLLRPALYGAKHRIFPLPGGGEIARGKGGDSAGPLTVAGPVCESGDVFLAGLRGAQAAALAGLEEGDLAFIADTGAYGAAMASNYNARPRAAEAMLLAGGGAALITRRETAAETRAREVLPEGWPCP